MRNVGVPQPVCKGPARYLLCECDEGSARRCAHHCVDEAEALSVADPEEREGGARGVRRIDDDLGQ